MGVHLLSRYGSLIKEEKCPLCNFQLKPRVLHYLFKTRPRYNEELTNEELDNLHFEQANYKSDSKDIIAVCSNSRCSYANQFFFGNEI